MFVMFVLSLCCATVLSFQQVLPSSATSLPSLIASPHTHDDTCTMTRSKMKRRPSSAMIVQTPCGVLVGTDYGTVSNPYEQELWTQYCSRYETAQSLFQQGDYSDSLTKLESAICLWSPRQVAFDARAMLLKLKLLLTPNEDTAMLQDIIPRLNEVVVCSEG